MDLFVVCGNLLLVCKVVEFLLLLSTYDVCTVVYCVCRYGMACGRCQKMYWIQLYLIFYSLS
jgi:hypothetical protein